MFGFLLLSLPSALALDSIDDQMEDVIMIKS